LLLARLQVLAASLRGARRGRLKFLTFAVILFSAGNRGYAPAELCYFLSVIALVLALLPAPPQPPTSAMDPH